MFVQNEMAEYILASAGAAFWIVTIIPQIVKSYKTKSTEGLSPWLMALWASSSLFFGSYVIAEKLNVAIQVQPHAFGTLCMVSWAQCCYYSRHWSAREAAGTLLAIMAIAGAFETTSIFSLWYGQLKGTEVPLLFYGYFSTALTIVGFIPQFYEIYRLRQVKGISLILFCVDITGGTLSAFALFFREELDIVALITYLGVASLDLLIIVLYFTLGHSDAPPHSISNLPPASGPRSRLSMLQTQGAQMEVQADSPVSSKWALTPSTGTLVEGFTPMTGRSEKRFFP
ncbi:PQ loop repeat-domain-containing protein [Dioszegia hungarica]|uniref:PQ loop repeat-domain-containing protein n=1 Tax=Dioszegia hungarica TaxID=4972 RepID=A0AA38LSD1_9TREE|nr:PQ loop repeat-domain-containing protein [Dioszegia hungarica]KAI9632444.1 PQ loop repeat-domain-containing protein [Dioszegia hungarica]